MATFLGAADHWLGVLAGVAGRYTEAARHLEAALARHRDMGSRPMTALTQDAYGRVLSMRGQAADTERARELTASAMRTAGELGLAAISGQARSRGADGARPAAGTPPRYGRSRNSAISGYTSIAALAPTIASRCAYPGSSFRW